MLENLLVAAQRPDRRAHPAELVHARAASRAEERRNVDEGAWSCSTSSPSTSSPHEPARILSGGQRKLLELARVLMADPAIILLDEPAAGVNPTLLETHHRRASPSSTGAASPS